MTSITAEIPAKFCSQMKTRNTNHELCVHHRQSLLSTTTLLVFLSSSLLCWHGYLSWARCRFAYAQLMPLVKATNFLSPIAQLWRSVDAPNSANKSTLSSPLNPRHKKIGLESEPGPKSCIHHWVTYTSWRYAVRPWAVWSFPPCPTCAMLCLFPHLRHTRAPAAETISHFQHYVIFHYMTGAFFPELAHSRFVQMTSKQYPVPWDKWS